MKKLHVFLLTILLTPLIAGLYGILHDQFTYTISPEYFTLFKFHQFRLAPAGGNAFLPHPRLLVALVGFFATWWTGLLTGIFNALIGLLQKDAKTMLNVVFKATLITILIAAITGLVGLGYGKFYLSNTNPNWWFPEHLIDKKSFITVGSMHNFSYLGGAIGLFCGIVYQLMIFQKSRKRVIPFSKNHSNSDI